MLHSSCARFLWVTISQPGCYGDSGGCIVAPAVCFVAVLPADGNSVLHLALSMPNHDMNFALFGRTQGGMHTQATPLATHACMRRIRILYEP